VAPGGRRCSATCGATCGATLRPSERRFPHWRPGPGTGAVFHQSCARSWRRTAVRVDACVDTVLVLARTTHHQAASVAPEPAPRVHFPRGALLGDQRVTRCVLTTRGLRRGR
jgi:hypothetical protein